MSNANLTMLFFGSLLPLAVIAYFMGKNKAVAIRVNQKMHSQPNQYGWLSMIITVIPALTVVTVGLFLYLFKIDFIPPTLLVAAGFAIAAFGLIYSKKFVTPDTKARNIIEEVIRYTLMLSSFISILTTFGILFSIIFESIAFFKMESFWYFITGTEWTPDAAKDAKFGAVPLFAGTFIITLIAMAVALPIGVLSAIYMSEYASYKTRSFVKPMLEVLAGIPTVVYGFFAAITVAPFIVKAADAVGIEASFNNALASGVVMGIMIIPIIASLSDDVISSVPQKLKNGSLALGMTLGETIKFILLPAAMPGIIAATLLGISRALGETMIVVMAAGLRPNLTANIFEDMTTVTVRIVDAFTGDQEFDSPETLSAFALGLILFIVTLILNTISVYMIKKFREKYASSNL